MPELLAGLSVFPQGHRGGIEEFAPGRMRGQGVAAVNAREPTRCWEPRYDYVPIRVADQQVADRQALENFVVAKELECLESLLAGFNAFEAIGVPAEDRNGNPHDFSQSATLQGAHQVDLVDQGQHDGILGTGHLGILNSPET